MLGLDKLVLYNDHSQDNYKYSALLCCDHNTHTLNREILEPYIKEGFVELVEWPKDAVKLMDQQVWMTEPDNAFYIDALVKCRHRTKADKKYRQSNTPVPNAKPHPQTHCQYSAFSDGYARHRDYVWAGAFDIDEFLAPMNLSLPVDQALPLSFEEYDKEGCTYIHFDSLTFGSSGHETTPAGTSPLLTFTTLLIFTITFRVDD